MIPFNPKELPTKKLKELFSKLEESGYYFKKEGPDQLVKLRKNSGDISPLVKLFGLGLSILDSEVLMNKDLRSLLIESDGQLKSPFSITSEDNGSLHIHDHWPPKETDDYIHLGQESFQLKTELDAHQDELKGKLVLDLGCGQGVLSLAAATHGAEVLGLDCSKRSIELAELMKGFYKLSTLKFIQSTIGDGNHALNSVRDFQQGRPLDLIVFNPPLVVSHSEQKVTYRDGGNLGVEILFLFLNFIKTIDSFNEIWFICGDPEVGGKRIVHSHLKKEAIFSITERRILKERFNQDLIHGTSITNIELVMYKLKKR
jgi:SAM-dependent methyltransferase